MLHQHGSMAVKNRVRVIMEQNTYSVLQDGKIKYNLLMLIYESLYGSTGYHQDSIKRFARMIRKEKTTELRV